MDAMLVVLEPRMKSVDTIKRILKLAADIEIKEVLAVGNKVRRELERAFIEKQMSDLGVPIAAYIPYDDSIAEADMYGIAPIDHDDRCPAVTALVGLKEFLKKRYSF